MSGKWLAKEETRLPKGSPASGTWVTNRIGFCTVTALGAAAAIARGAPATATSADAASASSSSTCPASAWGGLEPGAARGQEQGGGQARPGAEAGAAGGKGGMDHGQGDRGSRRTGPRAARGGRDDPAGLSVDVSDVLSGSPGRGVLIPFR